MAGAWVMGKKQPKRGSKDKSTKGKSGKTGGARVKGRNLIDDVRSISVRTAKQRKGKARGVAVYAKSKSGTSTRSRPAPATAGMHTVKTGSSTQEPMSFYFPFTPQQIQYANVGPELTEIQRPGKMPIIAFNRFKARQLSLKILLAVPQDGLFVPIDESMDFLFRMANTALPIYFTNMDRQISNPLTSSSSDNSAKIFWSITDLNFSSVRRNENNQITVAEANLTLVENMNPVTKAAELPVITYTEATPQTPKKKGTNKEDGYLTITQIRDIISTDTRT